MKIAQLSGITGVTYSRQRQSTLNNTKQDFLKSTCVSETTFTGIKGKLGPIARKYGKKLFNRETFHLKDRMILKDLVPSWLKAGVTKAKQPSSLFDLEAVYRKCKTIGLIRRFGNGDISLLEGFDYTGFKHTEVGFVCNMNSNKSIIRYRSTFTDKEKRITYFDDNGKQTGTTMIQKTDVPENTRKNRKSKKLANYKNRDKNRKIA